MRNQIVRRILVARAGIMASRGLATSTTFGKIGGKERLVILGSGWGGYNLARKIDKRLYDVTLVSPNSFFSFTPFLASTTVGTLEFRCATEPVRGLKHVDYAEGRAKSIDFEKKTVTIGAAFPSPVDNSTEEAQPPTTIVTEAEQKLEKYNISYDKLVIATGCRSASFGIPGVSEYAHFLKGIRDARAIRIRLLECLELASSPQITPEERRALLSFRIVGGGPTGVEFAAELHDFVKDDVYRLYPHLKREIEISLYDVAPGILMSFDESYAERKFAREKIHVKGNSNITSVGPDWIELDGKDKVPYGLLVWSTGLQVNPFIKSLKGVAKDDKTKLLLVDEHLTVLDEEKKPITNVFAIGDNSTPSDVASQMAQYLTTTLNKSARSSARGRPVGELPPFKWNNRGSMVFVGEQKALVDRSKTSTGPKNRWAGFAAWLVWRSYYGTLAMSWRNKLLVPMYWTLAYMFGRDVTRF